MRLAPWLGITYEERRQLEEDLVKALKERFHAIMSHSQNSHNEDNTKFTQTLSETELQLYWEGYASAFDYIKWKHSRKAGLERSWIVALHGRRKRRRIA